MNVDSSLIFLLSVAAAAGAAAWRLGSLEARVRSLEAFKVRAGERIGKIEASARHMERTLTGAQGITLTGGQVAEPVDDNSSER